MNYLFPSPPFFRICSRIHIGFDISDERNLGLFIEYNNDIQVYARHGRTIRIPMPSIQAEGSDVLLLYYIGINSVNHFHISSAKL